MNTEPEGMNMPDLTDELAAVLTAVEDGTLAPETDPADTALTRYDRQLADQKVAQQTAALSVLQQLGYIHSTHDGEWFIERAGREALAARIVAKEAEARRVLIASYTALADELNTIANAIGRLPVDGLVELAVEMSIRTTYRRDATDEAKTATVDAVASAVLAKTGTTERLGSSDTWLHKAEGRRGPVKVEVSAFVEDPTAREREAAEQERLAEVERLRAEVAELRRAASTSDDRSDR